PRHRTGPFRRPASRDDRRARSAARDAGAAVSAPADRGERHQARRGPAAWTVLHCRHCVRGEWAGPHRRRRFRRRVRLRRCLEPRARATARGAAAAGACSVGRASRRTDSGGVRRRDDASGMTTLRVLVADDEPLARQMTRRLLDAQADVLIVAECADGDALAGALEREAVDVMLLDVRMPGKDVFEVLADRARRAPAAMPAVIFTTA